MKRLTPLLMAASLLPAMGLADLHDPNNAADYMIVTTQQLINDYPWINELAEWRSDHGRVSMVVATDSIWTEFGTGVPSDTVLKTFLHYAYDNWQEPRLKDVFMIGFHDVVPSHVRTIGVDSCLSDFYYTTAMDSAFAAPRFALGRLPWSPTQSPEMWNYFAKITAYETAPTEDWQLRVHLMADSTLIMGIDTMIAQAMAAQVQPGYAIERDFLWYPDGHPWHGDHDEALANFNLGSYFAAFNGHAGGDLWGDALQIDSADCATLTNGWRLPIATGIEEDVSINDFALGDIPAALLGNANGGAIAYVAQTWYVYAGAITYWKSSLTRLVTSDSVQTLGDLWQQTATEYVQGYGSPSMVQTNMLFGDPGLVLPPRPTAAGEVPKPLPEDIRLLGNYPNPFNASTEIRYELNRDLRVSLKVYDVLGREAAALVNEPQLAGAHAVSWNALRAASGVYFAVLQAGGAMQTIKMMMLK